MLSIPTNISFTKIINKNTLDKSVELSVMRLDEIHDQISGNKIFKLLYYINECIKSNHNKILTFGGAYSNHLAATAFACKERNLKSIGVIRGEKTTELSHTLKNCQANDMELFFVSRVDYKDANNSTFIKSLKSQFGDFTLVPEGGYGKLGANGAALIMDFTYHLNATHICISVGTATTLAGLIVGNKEKIEIIAVPAIKNMIDIDDRLTELIGNYDKASLQVFNEYHFGGYAKYNTELLNFMNGIYIDFELPTDIVYTSKLMYGILEKINTGYFKKGSKIICLHTGGLQGNKSLPNGSLIF